MQVCSQRSLVSPDIHSFLLKSVACDLSPHFHYILLEIQLLPDEHHGIFLPAELLGLKNLHKQNGLKKCLLIFFS